MPSCRSSGAEARQRRCRRSPGRPGHGHESVRARLAHQRVVLDGGVRPGALSIERRRLGGAIAAYERVPPTSTRYVAAQLALARTLVDARIGEPDPNDLTRASDILSRLSDQDIGESPELHLAAATLSLSAVDMVEKGNLPPVGRTCSAARAIRSTSAVAPKIGCVAARATPDRTTSASR